MRGDCWYYSQSLVIQHGCRHLDFYNRRKAIPWGTFCCQEHSLLVWHDEIQVQIAQLRHTAMTQLENFLQRVARAPTPVGFKNFENNALGIISPYKWCPSLSWATSEQIRSEFWHMWTHRTRAVLGKSDLCIARQLSRCTSCLWLVYPSPCWRSFCFYPNHPPNLWLGVPCCLSVDSPFCRNSLVHLPDWISAWLGNSNLPLQQNWLKKMVYSGRMAGFQKTRHLARNNFQHPAII